MMGIQDMMNNESNTSSIKRDKQSSKEHETVTIKVEEEHCSGK